jgi:transcriptional regulator with XRE-family HTH domain
MTVVEGLGARIRRLRLAANPPLTLADLGGHGLSPGMVSKIERDLVTPSLQALDHLARRLGVPLSVLFEDDQQQAAVAASDSLRCAQALLWLGDPASAATAAEAGLQPAVAPLARARLLGVAAEALLAAGNVAAATARLLEATRLAGTADGESSPGPDGAEAGERWLGHAHLAWLLGLLERRRGDVGRAERSWSRCLDVVDRAAGQAAAQPEAVLIRGQTLAELGGLAELAGATETARNCYARSADILRRLADPASAARAALTGAISRQASIEGSSRAPRDVAAPSPAIAAALAAVAVAARAAERAEREVWRLERAALPSPATVPVPSVPHSRHLR